MRTFRVQVNGTEYQVAIEELQVKDAQPVAPRPQPANQAPEKREVPAGPVVKPVEKNQTKTVPKDSTGDSGAVLSPIPGTIIEVRVKQGAVVSKGDTLLILEAMKMENEIIAQQDGTVISLNVEKGAAVQAGSVLLILG